jgi:hypothetical protein
MPPLFLRSGFLVGGLSASIVTPGILGALHPLGDGLRLDVQNARLKIHLDLVCKQNDKSILSR